MEKIITFILLVCLPMTMVGATRYWEGDIDSDWNNGLNWDGNTLPSTGDIIIIDVETYTNAPVISAASSFSPASITVGDTSPGSAPDNPQFTINADLTVTGKITADNGSLMEMTGGDISIGHDLIAEGGAEIKISTTLTQTTSSEDISIGDGGAKITVEAGAVISGFDDITFMDTTSDQAAFVQTGGSVIIDDDVKMTSGTGDLLQISGGYFEVGDNTRLEFDGSTVEITGTAVVVMATFRLGDSGPNTPINNASVTIGGDANVTINEVVRLYGGGTGSTFAIEDNAYVDVIANIDNPELISIAPSATLLEAGEDLPVELIYFEAELVDRAIELRWSTASEIDNDYFEVYRSNLPDGEFILIGKVTGAGQSSQELKYELSDMDWTVGTNYYLLKQYDFDGASESFPVISYNTTEVMNREISVYPNHVTSGETLNISLGNFASDLTKQGIAVKIVSISGTLSKQIIAEISTQQVSVSTDDLPAGIYILTLQSRQSVFNRRVLIQE
ncbi:MAG: T9SS type A sorting domain-containing protein [Reichenbachiella sp.]|uniref:T9SS type A sorting domain-containing protein n=1 Tax=Reichenbachiella sp. TaxID=2184521 RepID=UPI0032634C40